MWRLDEKKSAQQLLDETEKEFYSAHLKDIQKYYHDNDTYWQNK